MSALQITAGLEITPKLRLLRPLGEGGMASVWVAAHLGLDAEVAVKFLSAELAAEDSTMLKRFKAEARTAAKLRSPHVVQIFDHGVIDARPYIVMELLEGESLGDRIERLGAMSLEQVAVVLDHSAKALAKAHSRGVVHRDIKPENLFNVEDGYELFIKVLDFGIAKQSQSLNPEVMTAEWEVTGTPEFMSPEQLVSSKDVDHRTDIWALGVVAYELLTTTVPFSANNLPDLFRAVQAGVFVPISERLPTAPALLDGWFAKAFALHREDRFDSALQMAQAFRAALDAGDVEPDTKKVVSESRRLTQPVEQRSELARLDATVVQEPIRHASTLAAVTGDEPPQQSSRRGLLALGAAAAMVLFGALLLFALGGESTASDPAAAVHSEPSAPAASAQVRASTAPEPVAERSAATVPSSLPASTSAAAVSTAPRSPRSPRLPRTPSSKTKAAAKPPTRTTNCEGINAFSYNKNGDLVPRSECLR